MDKLIDNIKYKGLKDSINTHWCKSEEGHIWDDVMTDVYSLDTTTKTAKAAKAAKAKGDKFFKDLVSKFIKPMSSQFSSSKNVNRHNKPVYLFYRILLAKWRVKYRKTYTKNRKELPNYLNKYHKPCSHVKAKAALTTLNKNIEELIKLYKQCNSAFKSTTNTLTKYNLLKSFEIFYNHNYRKAYDNIISIVDRDELTIDQKTKLSSRISTINKMVIKYNKTIELDVLSNYKTKTHDKLQKLKKKMELIVDTAASGGSKKTRTVTIKSNAMPKTVKGLQTKKKLLKKKIKKAEKKVKLSKDRIIRLK